MSTVFTTITLIYIILLALVDLVCLMNLWRYRDLGKWAVPSLFLFAGALTYMLSVPVIYLVGSL